MRGRDDGRLGARAGAPGYGWPLGERSWVNPSPNAPNLSMARCYAGTVMLEGTTLSEGRGTTRPLELFGAPDLDARALLGEDAPLAPQWLRGCRLRPCWFEPTFHKHAGKLCAACRSTSTMRPTITTRSARGGCIALAFKALRACSRTTPCGATFRTSTSATVSPSISSTAASCCANGSMIALMLGGGMSSVAIAEQTVGSGLVVVFIAIVPLFIVLVNLFWRVKPRRLEIAGIGLGFAGVLMLTRGQGFQASPVGLVAVATACTCWSIGSVLSQRVLPLAPGAMGFASEMLAGGLVVLVLAGLTGESMNWPPQPLAAWAWAYLVVFGSLLAFNAYMVLLARTSAGLAASYTFVNPVIAMLLGITFGNETVTTQEWAAACVILAGVVLLLLRPAR